MRSDVVAVRPDLGTAEAALVGLLGRKRSVRVGGVHGGAVGLVLAALASQEKSRPPALMALVPDAKAAESVALDFAAFSASPPFPFPAWPHEPGESPPDADTLAARVAAFEALAASREGRLAGKVPTLVVPVAALAQDVPTPAVLSAATLSLRVGASHPPTSLLEHLALSGFVRVGAVESPGEFAGRGGVVDVFPFGAATPLRLDFFGDTLESIRELDAATQRSGAARDEVRLLCLAPERVRDPASGVGPSSLLDHLPPDSLVVLVEPATVAARLAMGKGEAGEGGRLRWKRLDDALKSVRRLDLASLRLGAEGDLDVDVGTLDEVRGLAARAERAAASKGRAEHRDVNPQALLVEAVKRVLSRADRIVVLRRAAGEEQRLREILPDDRVSYAQGSLSGSFLFGPTRTAWLAYDDLADLSVRERRPARSLPSSRPIQDFLELEVGETVVHVHHGVGVFRGLETTPDSAGPTSKVARSAPGAQALKIEFAEGTTLHVPVARIDLVQRYVGTGRRPKLSKVGGTEWAARKSKVEDAVAEFAQELIEVQASRARRTGPPYVPHPQWQAEFERAFPWKDTPDQTSATAAIKADLAGPRPMDRLLCGDVGYGKTEVALRAAFLAATAGRQVAVLVPTTVLAEQHRRTFESRLAPYPLVVRALSRFRTPAEAREILAGLADGSVDVVVGTHRLLSKDIVFRDLGLVVVDEEQRFGVQHKERLKALRADVDVITLSATPIPRTLHMALLGIRDISNLTTPPPGRLPIETRVARTDESLIRETIRRELDRGGQVFFVHNRVLDLHQVAGMVMRLVPVAKVAVIHGQMDRDLVEARMFEFVHGLVDVLVTTTIVESGLDIPNANTMVIHNADRFGLAELHQLRGRVGREQRHAHCLLLIEKDRSLSEVAAHRLRALEEYSELGAGFRIAIRDLELRGAGNLLGAEQSGHIAAVGYDLYCRLLGDAVRRARHDPPRLSDPATVDVELACGLPPSYVSDPRETFRLFRRVSTAPTVEVLQTLHEEMVDRFGDPPPQAERLFLYQATRLRAGAIGIERVVAAEAGGLTVEAREGGPTLERLASLGIVVRRTDTRRAYLPPPPEVAKAPLDVALEASLRALVGRLETRGLPTPTDGGLSKDPRPQSPKRRS